MWDSCDASIWFRLLNTITVLENLTKVFGKPLDIKFIEAQRKILTNWLNSSDCALETNFKDRLSGLLGILSCPRPQKVLCEWKDAGLYGVRDEDISSFDKRRSLAHGNFDFDEKKLQDFSYAEASMSGLINRILLTKMKYHGPYLDYGVKGWPIKEI